MNTKDGWIYCVDKLPEFDKSYHYIRAGGESRGPRYGQLLFDGAKVLDKDGWPVQQYLVASKDPETMDNTVATPRTYPVTRQQMKEIHDACVGKVQDGVKGIIVNFFNLFEMEASIPHEEVKEIAEAFEGSKAFDILKSIFPEYFFIPEGEPVLCRDNDGEDWHIQISDGMGGAYSHNRNYGGSVGWRQIIPFTKNPPK